QAHPDSARVRLKLAWLELEAGRKTEARGLLLPLRQRERELSTEELLELGHALAALGDTDGAREGPRKFPPRDGRARRVGRAPIHHQGRDWRQVRELLERLRGEPLPVKGMAREVQLLLADCYTALGSPDQTAAALRGARREAAPGRAERVRLAEALAASGKAD